MKTKQVKEVWLPFVQLKFQIKMFFYSFFYFSNISDFSPSYFKPVCRWESYLCCMKFNIWSESLLITNQKILNELIWWFLARKFPNNNGYESSRTQLLSRCRCIILIRTQCLMNWFCAYDSRGAGYTTRSCFWGQSQNESDKALNCISQSVAN